MSPRTSDSERRQHPRVACSLETAAGLLPTSGNRRSEETTILQPAVIKNISQGGVFLAAVTDFEEGAIIDFGVKLPNADTMFYVTGKVHWKRTSEPTGIGVGFIEKESLLTEKLGEYIEQAI